MTRKPVGRLSFENERNDVSHDVIADIDRILSTNHVMEPELNIGLLLWPEFPLLALAGLTDTLRHAADIGDNSKKMRCSWNLMSADPARSVCASSGFRIHADSTHLPPENFDYIAVIGGLLRSLSQGAAADRNYLHLAHQKGVPVIGICTGSFILAEEGLLKGHTAAVHPFHLKDFHARFPAINAVAGKDYIDGGDIITSPGGISTTSLAAELVRRHCGQDRATKAVHQMFLPNKIDSTPISVSRALGFTPVSDPRLRKAVFMIEQFLVRPVTTQWLATEVSLSTRQLTRLFKEELGKTPGVFIRSAKLRYGQWLLRNSTESVTEIALRLGFNDCAHFIRCFSNEYGCAPGHYRNENSLF